MTRAKNCWKSWAAICLKIKCCQVVVCILSLCALSIIELHCIICLKSVHFNMIYILILIYYLTMLSSRCLYFVTWSPSISPTQFLILNEGSFFHCCKSCRLYSIDDTAPKAVIYDSLISLN